jgi:pyruvate formate lyase activating enzyme
VLRGFQPQSFSDYQGKIAAVLFAGGCNLRCRFCYNAPLVLRPDSQPALTADQALELLRPRTEFLDAVVVTGGEPTLLEGLVAFLGRLRSLGLLLGLDSNGTRPAVLRAAIADGLVDRLAVDYKAPRRKYGEVTGRDDVGDAVAESLSVLGETRSVRHEVRLTLHPALHTAGDVAAMAHELAQAGIRNIALQTFQPWNVLDKMLLEVPGYSTEELRTLARQFTGQVTVR